jgi:hypothetical protein
MMNAQELMTIKGYQREFEEKYGKKLIIDWNSMKGVRRSKGNNTPTAQELLDQALVKYSASLDVIKSGCRLFMNSHENERLAIEDFCKNIAHHQINYGKAAKLINRDRSIIYYYEKRVQNV